MRQFITLTLFLVSFSLHGTQITTKQIADSAVTDPKVNDISVSKITSATSAYFTYKPSNVSCSDTQTLIWNNANSRWVCGTPSSGTVTSVNLSGGTTGLTTSGGPVTSSGTITLGGILAIANGGTGQSTASNAINALLPTQTGNSGKYLSTDGSAASWQAVSTGINWSTPVNANIEPDADNTRNIGSSSKIFQSTFTGSLKNSLGDPVISTGDKCLTTGGSFILCWTSIAATVYQDLLAANVNKTLGSNSIKWGSLYVDAIYDKTNSSGSASQVLTADGAGKFSWTTPSSASGTVTSVNVSGGTTGLSFSGGPVTSAGTITMAGTLGISNGGTGQTSATAGFNALAPSQTGNSGKYLTTDGTNSSWATVAGGSPGGTSGQLQYNNSGSFGGLSGVTWDTTTPAANPFSRVKFDNGGSNTQLQWGSSGFLNSYGSDTISISNNVYYKGSSWYYANASKSVLFDMTSAGDFNIYMGPSGGTAGSSVSTLTNVFKIDSSRNFYFNDASLSSASTNYVWTLQSTSTGQGAWKAVSGGSGTVTSVNVSGGTTGLTFSGGPVTTSGTITAAGTLGIANGGTGATTATAATNALLPTQTGNSGKFLTTDGTNTSWGTASGSGTVTSVAMTVPSFLTVTGSPITTNGTLALTYSGTALPVANGGTGQTTASAAFDALAPSQTGNSGKYLTTNGTTTSWATVSGGGSPGGTSGQVQFNNAGAFGGDSELFWDNTNKRLNVQAAGGRNGVTFQFGPNGFMNSNTSGTYSIGAQVYQNSSGSWIKSSSSNGWVIDFPTSGLEMYSVTGSAGGSASLTKRLTFSGSNGGFQLNNGSAANPAYTFINQTSTGMYYGGSSDLIFSTGGTARYKVSSAGLVPFTTNNLALGTTSAYWTEVSSETYRAGTTGYQAYNTSLATSMASFKDAITSPSGATMVGVVRNSGASTQAVGITGGADASSASALGDVLIEGQNNTSTGAGGAVKIRGGNSTSGVGGGIVLTTPGTKPTCSSTTRGMYWHFLGGTGVKDTVEVCAKDASDVYAWRTIY